MTGLKAQLNRKLHECGRDPLSLFLLGGDYVHGVEFFTGVYFVAGAAKYRNRFVCFAI